MLSSFLFFFKQKTAYEMRISDWSSDVCSSDLRGLRRRLDHRQARPQRRWRQVGCGHRGNDVTEREPREQPGNDTGDEKPPHLDESVRRIGAAGRATLDSALDTGRALRRLVSADQIGRAHG